MPIIVRRAMATDVPAMHAIRLAARENRLANASDIGEDSYRPYVERGSAWVAIADDHIIGFAALDLSRATVWALFVDHGAEGLGVGRALQKCMIEEAVAQHLTRLELTTTPGTRAELFYHRAGWTPLELTEAGEIRFERSLA